MKASFWHSCWEKNSLGFHQKTVHPFLYKYLLPLIHKGNQTVFVPLCGKSDDMVWLAEHMQVVGAELSDIACRDFFSDKGIVANIEQIEDFQKYSNQNLEIWQGDFFQLSSCYCPCFDWIYDRAAIIALPKTMQIEYVQHLSSFIGKSTKLFLVSLEFPQEELEGPPFALFEQDIYTLFSNYRVECIAEQNLDNKMFAQRTFDVSFLREKLYIISIK